MCWSNVICNIDVLSYHMLWFITNLVRGTLSKLTLNQARLSSSWVLWHADHVWRGWAGLVQCWVVKISPHSWLTSGTTWGAGVPGGGTDKMASSQDCIPTACETQSWLISPWANMPMSLKYINPQTFISIKMLSFESISHRNVIFEHVNKVLYPLVMICTN